MSIPAARQEAATGERYDAGQAGHGQVRQQPDRPYASFAGLAAPAVQYLGVRSPEANRRRRLAATDQLLNEIEELRLEARSSLPSHLLGRIVDVEAEIIGHPTRSRINGLSLRRAHEFVLDLQYLLMAANPGNPTGPRLDATVSGDTATRS